MPAALYKAEMPKLKRTMRVASPRQGENSRQPRHLARRQDDIARRREGARPSPPPPRPRRSASARPASFSPSPTIITVLPESCSRRIKPSLSSGLWLKCSARVLAKQSCGSAPAPAHYPRSAAPARSAPPKPLQQVVRSPAARALRQDERPRAASPSMASHTMLPFRIGSHWTARRPARDRHFCLPASPARPSRVVSVRCSNPAAISATPTEPQCPCTRPRDPASCCLPAKPSTGSRRRLTSAERLPNPHRQRMRRMPRQRASPCSLLGRSSPFRIEPMSRL